MTKSPSHVTSGHKHPFTLIDLQNTILIVSQPYKEWKVLLTHRQTLGEKYLFLVVAGNNTWQAVLYAQGCLELAVFSHKNSFVA